MSLQRIIIDTDPGLDDALTIFLALASPEVQIEAITTVCGNVGVDLTTRNALSILELAGRTDIPVARGCSQPLVGSATHASYVHGENGLGNVELPEPVTAPSNLSAVELIIEKLSSAPGEITIVAIGPLTNLAEALQREPRIAEYAREVVIMGGALLVPGNVTPHAEFNIFADPQAAQIVLRAGWPVRMVSLDVTNTTLLARKQVEQLAANGHSVTGFIRDILAYYFDIFAVKSNLTDVAMHDPLCFAAAIQPEFITWQRASVDVELHDRVLLGKTMINEQATETNVAFQPMWIEKVLLPSFWNVLDAGLPDIPHKIQKSEYRNH